MADPVGDIIGTIGRSPRSNVTACSPATVRLDLPFAATEEVTAAMLKALDQVGTAGRAAG